VLEGFLHFAWKSMPVLERTSGHLRKGGPLAAAERCAFVWVGDKTSPGGQGHSMARSSALLPGKWGRGKLSRATAAGRAESWWNTGGGCGPGLPEESEYGGNYQSCGTGGHALPTAWGSPQSAVRAVCPTDLGTGPMLSKRGPQRLPLGTGGGVAGVIPFFFNV
jgi:hypothetical protein